MSISSFCSSLNVLLGGIIPSKADVFSNAGVKENRFLTDYTNVTSQPLDVQITDIVPINGDLSEERISTCTEEYSIHSINSTLVAKGTGKQKCTLPHTSKVCV